MRRIVVATFTSLDGVMQAPRRPAGRPDRRLHASGWTALISTKRSRFPRRDLRPPFDCCSAARAYDIFAAHWPYVTDPNDPIAPVFKPGDKYVARAPAPGWLAKTASGWAATSSPRSGAEGRDGPDLLVQGSSDLLQHCGRRAWSTS